MTVQKVQHSELKGNLCHEPKGADTAAADTVYIADGEGSGSFQQMPLNKIYFSRASVSNLVLSEIAESLSLDFSDLSQLTDGSLENISYTLNISAVNNINKNFKELAEHVANADTQISEIATAITNLENKVNSLLEALRTAGVLSNA